MDSPPREEGLGEVVEKFNMQVRGPKSGFRKTIPLRRDLRHNLTAAEKQFWSKVANRNFYNLKFRKQHGIGKYIVDFYCAEKKVVIEIDGDSHASLATEDQQRTKYLTSFGYRVIRYNNRDVISNIEGVLEDLVKQLALL